MIDKIKKLVKRKNFEKTLIDIFTEKPHIENIPAFVEAVYRVSRLNKTPALDTLILQIYNVDKKVYWIENYDGWIRRDCFQSGIPFYIDLEKGLVAKLKGDHGKLLFITDDINKANAAYDHYRNEIK